MGMGWLRLPWDHAHGLMWLVKVHSLTVAFGSGKRLVRGGYCAQNFQECICLQTCGVFSAEVALLAERHLVELCKCKFLWYEGCCTYHGVTPDLVYWSSLLVSHTPAPNLFHTAQYREHWDQLQSAQHVHVG